MGRIYVTQFRLVLSSSKMLFVILVGDFRFGWVAPVSNFSAQNNAPKFKYPW